MTNKYDSIIRRSIIDYFPALGEQLQDQAHLLIKAQIYQESRFNPQAVSPVGALGLMQLMPATAQYLGVTDPIDPEQNINAGVKYLSEQYEHLAEIPRFSDRISAALASYNGGRGYINKALALGRVQCGEPESFWEWREHGRTPGAWQMWPLISRNLEYIEHNGERPDYKQMQNYVTHIMGYFVKLCVDMH
jgi:membrane-bound lytic murein transglycosylase MltF